MMVTFVNNSTNSEHRHTLIILPNDSVSFVSSAISEWQRIRGDRSMEAKRFSIWERDGRSKLRD